MRKGFSQIDYIVAIGMFLIVFGFIVMYFTNYLTPIGDVVSISSLRSRSTSIMDSLYSEGSLSLTGESYTFKIEVTNSEEYHLNQSKPITDLTSEIVRFNFTAINYPHLNYYSTAIYDENNTFVPYYVSGDEVMFKTDIQQHETKTFTVYVSDDPYFSPAQNYIAGYNALTQAITPLEETDMIQYGRFRNISLKSYNILSRQIGGDFNIRIVTNETTEEYGASVPKRSDVVALEKSVLCQTRNRTVTYGEIIVSAW